MKFGLFGGARSPGASESADSQAYTSYIDYVLRAEELGFTGVFVVEHHFTGVGQVSASLNLLSYLAARTGRIRLGTAVVVLPWHNPALLAEQVATLDLLSGGRFDFGVGKGYRESEFAGFCMPMAEAHERYDEIMQFLRRAWTSEGRFSHHGKFWNFENVVIEPRPVQRPHPPFWVGAGSFDGIRRAAQENFNLLLDQLAPIDLICERVALYRAELERHGHAFDGLRVGVARALMLLRDESERKEAFAMRRRTLQAVGDLARGPGAERYRNAASLTDAEIAADDAALLGTADEIVARLKRLKAGGVEYVLLVDPSGSQESLRLFAEQVMPKLADAGPGRQAAE